MKFVLILLAALVLTACASLTDDQCRAGDWQAIGFADGVDGRESKFLQNHIAACQPTNLAPDEAAWEQGRQQGLEVYCTPLKAYIEGRGGKIIKRICPAPLQRRLIAENNRGISARFSLRDDRRDGVLISIPNPGLFRAPRAILDLPDGRNEYDILRREVSALRTAHPLWF